MRSVQVLARLLVVAVASCAICDLNLQAQASSANDGKAVLDSQRTVPKDIFPDSGNRLPLIKRESLDEGGRKAYDDAVALSNSGVGTPQGVAAIPLHGLGGDGRWAAPVGRRMTARDFVTADREGE